MQPLKICIVVVAVGGLVAAQRGGPGAAAAGAQIYQSSCTLCHGPAGTSVPGVDLGHDKFRRASSDAELIKIIRGGIPGTAMPPGNYSEQQAATIVAYLHSMATSARATSSGDAERGKTIFAGKGGCTNCHRVRGAGSRFGPDLTEIGVLRRPADLERSLVEPDAEILPQNRVVRATTRDGSAITGRLLNQDPYTLQMIDSKERLLSFNRSDLREFVFLDKSPMPSFRGRLSQQELADVVSYLVSLKGIDKQ